VDGGCGDSENNQDISALGGKVGLPRYGFYAMEDTIERMVCFFRQVGLCVKVFKAPINARQKKDK
jgi:hypothetical protein